MAKAADTVVVVECCQNELLKQLLPVLHSGLESCQKSLESYLEGKRNKFPRFYFVSNPVLLKILSQGSDAESVQEDFEKLFDAISRVGKDRKEKEDKFLHALDKRKEKAAQRKGNSQGETETLIHTYSQRDREREMSICVLRVVCM